ncbi:hypothetical protein CLIB1444_02S02322 [[Candida] jaroonii]|uniref:Uncharacterized protein n=1 Tax=[Candida] jaroonii TaxID=467808 RepID=A0ACA9Y2K0_9ASCO|nr:hypothetical protein CLIB1444_02S02322 [[Candida] jaroonii]
MLKNLGVPIQKSKDQTRDSKVEEKIDDNEDTHKKLKDYYDSIAYMTADDLMIQQNLDQGKQFNSFDSEHYLDRKTLTKNIPNEIDIFETPYPEIEKIYKDLNKLDTDKTVQLKYYKRYLDNYSDPVNLLLQEFNRIDEKFKLLRRDEIDNLNLNPNSYFYHENLFNLSYNVLGFDRSISGFPLRMGKHKLTDVTYPVEFIQDLQMCQKKIKLHKKDLDFVEYNENSLSINPNNLNNPQISDNQGSMNKVIDMIYNELDVPKNFLIVDDVHDYNCVKFKFLNKFNSILETEINTLKASLQKEIEFILSSNNESKNLLLFNHQSFKTNQYKLCDFVKENKPNNDPIDELSGKPQVVLLSYNIQEFNLIPYTYLINRTRRSRKRLFNHIFKLFLINLKDQIETLLRIKYSKKKSTFINNLNLKITNITQFKLMNFFYSINDLKLIKPGHAIYLKPYKSRNYKRLYNYKLLPVEKRSIRLDSVELDELL